MALSQAAAPYSVAQANLELLRQRLRQALFAKKTRLRELMELCQAQRAELRVWIRQRREQALAELREELRQARGAAAANRRSRLQDARRSARSNVELARAQVEIERAHAAEHLRITHAHDTKRIAIDKAHARSLSDDLMSAATLQRLRPLLEKAGKVRPAPGESRTEALWRYARAHPEEMHALLEPTTERVIAQTQKQIVEAEAALRSGGPLPRTLLQSEKPAKSARTAAPPPKPSKPRATPPPPPSLRLVTPPTASSPPRVKPQRPAKPSAPERLIETRKPRKAPPAPSPVEEPLETIAPPPEPAPPPVPVVAPSPPPAAPARAKRAARPRPQLGLDFNAPATTPAVAPRAALEQALPLVSSEPKKSAAARDETPERPRARPSVVQAIGDTGRSARAKRKSVASRGRGPALASDDSDAGDDSPPPKTRATTPHDDPPAPTPPGGIAHGEAHASAPIRLGAPTAATPVVEPSSPVRQGADAAKTSLPRLSASYDPGDNKLRLRSLHRLDPETYARVKAAGFGWAPKQDLFVAPAWTPQREDLLLELCGEIDDEDTSLVDRAEVRAERFEGYEERRADEAAGAHRAVEQVSKRFEFGQPILVGHHSERRARKDAEKIQAGMRKAVSLWKTSKYWAERAKGALRHAKYKERPDVRHRRIKGIESDRRKQVRTKEEAERFGKLWNECNTLERALAIANHDHLRTPDALGPDGKVVTWGTSYWSALKDGLITVEAARARAIELHEATIRRCDRWIEHFDHRLAYERAMLDEGGGIPAAKFDLQVGGQILYRFGWGVILRLNRKGGQTVSVTVAAKYGRGAIGIEEIRDYKPPAEGDAAKVAAAAKLPPLVNYPGDGFRHMTQAEWDKQSRASDFSSARRVAATQTHGAHRLRMAPKEGRPYYDIAGVYVTDAKRVDPPPPSPRAELPARELDAPPPPRAARPPAEPTVFDAMAASLKAGVKVVSADQLFPTPPELAERVAELANILPGERVLEPSAGTGSLLRAVLATTSDADVVAVEISADLARALAANPGDGSYSVRHADFLTLGPSELGNFDCVIMNPPFASGADVKHILHARTLLKPGGRLVAICANGPRQREALQPLADTWEELPEGTFKSSGTNVRTVLLTMRAASGDQRAKRRSTVSAQTAASEPSS